MKALEKLALHLEENGQITDRGLENLYESLRKLACCPSLRNLELNISDY